MSLDLLHMPNNVDTAQGEPFGKLDLRQIWSLFRRRWRVLAGAIAIAVALTIICLTLITPIYTATATVLIDPRKTNTVKSEAIVSDFVLDANSIATEVSLVKSFSVARRVAERLKLEENPLFGDGAPKQSVFGWLSEAIFRSHDSQEIVDAESDQTTAPGSRQPKLSHASLGIINEIAGGLHVRRLATTYFLEISFSHSDSELSAMLANAVAESYLDEQLEARYRAGQRAASWLSERVSAIRVQLEASERSLAEHRAIHNLANPQAGTLAEQQAAEINAQLVATRAQTVEKNAKQEQAQRILDGGAGIETVAAVMDAPAIAALRTQEATIALQEADLLNRYGPKHPALLKIRAEHADVIRQIKLEVGRVVQTLKTDYEFAQKKERSLESSLRELTGSQNLNDPAIIRLRELERDAQANRTLYETMLARFKEAEQQTTLQSAESRIVAPAFVPVSPSFPKKAVFLLAAILAGLILGAGAIALLEYLEDGFTAAAQVERTLELPVLAVVPMLAKGERSIDGRIAAIAEYAALKPQTHFGESIRSARMTTQMSNLDQPPKLVLVTSSISAEGKTTIAMSLALSAAAAANQRVLLIDCDLRAQSASKQFKLLGKPGLSDLLTDQMGCDRAMFRSNIPNLTILPAGAVTGNPPDLLGSERMRTLLKALRESYEIIYLDAPPLLPVVDSIVLSKFADKIVLVVRWRSTPRNIVMRATQLIENSVNNISGIILNNASIDQLMSYDPYNTYYHKMYQSYYEQ